MTAVVNEAPAGFWTDLAASIRKELPPTMMGNFSGAANAPVQGVLQGNVLILECSNPFTLTSVNKPEILDLVARKASAKLGRQIHVKAMDRSNKPKGNARMENLLDFGRAHSDIVKIKEH